MLTRLRDVIRTRTHNNQVRSFHALLQRLVHRYCRNNSKKESKFSETSEIRCAEGSCKDRTLRINAVGAESSSSKTHADSGVYACKKAS
jgi:hypothetical protein